MKTNDFFLTLPSNSSMKYFPDNTLSSFKVLLPRMFTLSSDFQWEIGLSEIQYPISLQTTTNDPTVIIGMEKKTNPASLLPPAKNSRIKMKKKR